MVFHLHGHHVRLLDRLDDGWKPFWLDTLLIDAGQTQRIAFAAEFAGNWLMGRWPSNGARRVGCAGSRWSKSMIPKSGYRFSDKIMLKQKIGTSLQV
jgi:hypothetical protein